MTTMRTASSPPSRFVTTKLAETTADDRAVLALRATSDAGGSSSSMPADTARRGGAGGRRDARIDLLDVAATHPRDVAAQPVEPADGGDGVGHEVLPLAAEGCLRLLVVAEEQPRAAGLRPAQVVEHGGLGHLGHAVLVD